MFRRISSDLFYMSAADALARILSFIAMAHIARTLGTEFFGFIIIALSILSYAQWTADLGLSTIGTREIARPQQERQFDPLIVPFLKLALASIVLLLSQAGLFLLDLQPGLERVIRLFLLFLLVEAMLTEWYAKGLRRFKLLAISRTISGLLFVGAALSFVHQPADLPRVPLIYIGAFSAATIFLLLKIPGQSWQLSREAFRGSLSLIRQSSTIGFSTLFGQLIGLLPPLALAAFADSSAAGIYGAAMKVVAIALAIDRIFISIFFPAVSRLWKSNRERCRTWIQLAYRLALFGGGLIGLLLFVLSDTLMQVIYGEAYLEGVTVLRILSWFILPTLLNSLFAFSLIAIGQEKLYFQAAWRSSLIASLLILLGAAGYGLMGAAGAALIGEMLVAAAVFIYCRRYLRFPVLAPLLTAFTALAGALAAAPLLTPISAPPVVALIYILIFVLLRGISPGDLKQVNET